jgi:predicted metal-dependent HD superfamily phosphohydrolase
MTVDETMLRVAWERSVGSGRPARRLFDAVVARHREPHRRYHGVRHVAWVARHAEALAEHEPVHDLGAVVTAACFHDAVYQPTASDNEEASARLARRELTDLADPAWPADRIERVAAMIVATATHLAPSSTGHVTGHDAGHDTGDVTGHDTGHVTGHDADTAVLLDADLGVLGADPAAYQHYVNGVRAEYGHLDPVAWRTGRRAVVQALADRPELYLTDTARGWWEARARANLTAELASLT